MARISIDNHIKILENFHDVKKIKKLSTLFYKNL